MRILDFSDGFTSATEPASEGLAASSVTITPITNLVATTAQAAFSEHQTDINDLVTLSGRPANSTDLGTFTGTTISDTVSVKTALQELETSVESKISSSEKAAANGVATLDAGAKIPSSQLPAIALTEVFVVADITARDALTVQEGDVAKVLDNGSGLAENYIYDGSTWVTLKSDDKVDSVNGQTGTVSLTTTNISEGTNLYYTEARVSANASVTANTAKVSADGSIDTHSDVDTSTTPPTDGQVLTWNNGSGQWVPASSAASAYQLQSATSSAKVPTGNNTFLQMTGNSLTLGPGTWELLPSLCDWSNTGSVGYGRLILAWFGANGADTSTPPTLISALTGATVNTATRTGYVGYHDLNAAGADTRGQITCTGIITLTQTQTIYLVPYLVSSVTAANASVIVYPNAKRILA